MDQRLARRHCSRRLSVLAFTFAFGLTGCAGGGEPAELDASPSGSGQGSEPGEDPQPEGAERTTQAPRERSITIVATGDVLPHAPVLQSAAAYATAEGEYDFGPMFAEIEPLVSAADIALCHMETPLSEDNTGLTQPRVLSFATPHEIATALNQAGYDGCDFASNHTMDRGVEGLAETEDVLREAGLGYAGPTGYEDRAGVPQTYTVDGVVVAHLAYTYTLPNAAAPTTDVPDGAEWLGESLWPLAQAEGIIEDATDARDEGADVVVVSMHWGQEYSTAATTEQMELAESLLTSDEVDLILGTHVHVPQPCAKINGRYVLYGLGNSLSNQSPDVDARLRPETQEGMVAQVELTLTPGGEVSSELAVQPTRVNLAGHIIEPAGAQDHPETATRTMRTLAEQASCEPKELTP